jgi:hypothetical protein
VNFRDTLASLCNEPRSCDRWERDPHGPVMLPAFYQEAEELPLF